MSGPATADEWADRYGELRGDGAGAMTAWLGIPLAVMALIGMLWATPVPEALAKGSPIVNYGTLLVMAAFVYYCILSIRLAVGALLLLVALTAPSFLITRAGLALWPVASAVFVPTLCWLLLETRRVTGRLCILRNLQYLMLGPLWLVREIYRRMGIAY